MADEERRRSTLSWTLRTRGLCILLAAFMAAFGTQSAQARKFKVLYTFTGKDGAYPYAGLLHDKAGNTYGTTAQGGVLSACGGVGCGVVFKVDKIGRETLLHTFTGGSDGGDPAGNLVSDSLGNIYGTAGGGGLGYGVVFLLETSGKETVLYTFSGGIDGNDPQGNLLRDGGGNLYGTATNGGDLGGCNGLGCGVIFALKAAGVETVLYTFTGGADGGSPLGLIRDSKGNFYGEAAIGGDLGKCFGQGCGVVFKLSAAGKFAVLHTFEGGVDGSSPLGGLVRDSSGNLYGTTSGVGDSTYGTVFKLKGQAETVLHNFEGQPSDGREPRGSLVRDGAGNLYGSTYWGGTANGQCEIGCGTVFEVDANGNETLLHKFNPKRNPEQGALPTAGLTKDGKGNLYGTTFVGGDATCGCGVIFKLAP